MSDARPLAVVRRLPATVDAPRSARDAAAAMAKRMGKSGRARAEDLALIVSELVTNAVVHGPGEELELRLTGTPEMIRVEVHDNGNSTFDWPGPDADGHRGLSLVGRFSERAGVVHTGSTLVWCELDLA